MLKIKVKLSCCSLQKRLQWVSNDFLFRPIPADFPDVVFARHGESSAAFRSPGSREIRLTHGESVHTNNFELFQTFSVLHFNASFKTSSFASGSCIKKTKHLCVFQIEDGEIYASINQKDGMVCFHDNPEKYNNPAMLHKIDQEVILKSACGYFFCFNILVKATIIHITVSLFLFTDVEMYRAG